MSGATKLMTAGGGGVQITPDASIASDVTVKLPTAGINNGTLVCSDSSGNVGIGTSSPTDSQSFTKALDVNGTSGAAVYVRTAGSATNYAYIGSYGADGYAANRGSGSFIFANGGSERMRIDSSGNLLVGTTSSIGTSTARLEVNGIASGGRAINTKVDTTSSANHISFNNPNGQIGYISSSGTSTTYSTSSDYRLKENIQPMQNALAVVQQLNPVTYTWKSDGSDGQGFIAHELQEVVPDCVTGEKDAVDEEGKPVYQGIDTSFLVATLCKAIQEQQEQINELKAEVALLKGAA